MDGLYCIEQSQQLHLQDQNRNNTTEENGTEEENDDDSLIEDPQYVSNEANVGLDTEMHVPGKYKGKRRGRKPKGPKHHSTNPNGSGNHVASETQKHAGNHTGRHRGRKPKGPKPSTDKDPNGGTSSNQVALEAQKHTLKYTSKRRGRKPKGGPKLHAEKNPNGNSNHVTLEAQKYAGKRAKNHAVPMTVNEKGVSAVKSACFGQTEGQTIDHGTKVNHSDTQSGIATTVKEEIEDYDDDCAPHIRRPVQDPVLNAEHFWHDDEANARTLTKFRGKLMEELKMPYCQEEYERLLKEITVRKPDQRQKVLRGRIKIYEEDYDGSLCLIIILILQRK